MDQQEAALFQGLQDHSVLYMLHQLTSLSALVPAEVVKFLKGRPHLAAAAAAGLLHIKLIVMLVLRFARTGLFSY